MIIFFFFSFFSDASRPFRKETSTTVPKNGVSSPAASPEATTSPRGKFVPDTGDRMTSSTPSPTDVFSHEFVNKTSDSDIFKTDSKENVTDDKDVADDSSSESSYMSLPASVSSDLSKTESNYYDDISNVLGNTDKSLISVDENSEKENALVNTIPAAITCTIISKSPSNMSSDTKAFENDPNLSISPPKEESHLSTVDSNQKVIFILLLFP